MDAITLIVTALSAGASAGVIDSLTDDIKESAKVAYKKLHQMTERRFRGNPSAEIILAEHAIDPNSFEAPLSKKLVEAGASDDPDLVAAARALMEYLDREGVESGKYHVTIKGSKGVQVGDGNLQVNKW
jgi:hypothetical protein